jgi:CxxC motif-containing protein
MHSTQYITDPKERLTMTTTASYLCIGCPLGCRLEVDEDEEGLIVEVRGFSCKRGKTYAMQEHTSPQRTVTTTVGITGGLHARLPVRTTGTVAKARVMDVCHFLRTITVAAPVQMGDVIVENMLNTGTNIVATRHMPAADLDSGK